MESRDDLKAYLDGELTVAQAEAVRVAAESDPDTVKELEELRLVGSTLSALKKEYEVEGLEKTLRALDGDGRAASPAAPKKRWTWYGVGVGIAAAVTLLYALPPMFGTAKMAAKSSLASRRFVAADTAAPAASPGFAHMAGVRPPRIQAPNAAAKSSMGAIPMKPPLSPQDQIKADEAKLKQLQNENARLKAEQAATSKSLVPPSGMALPAPMSPGDILPNESGMIANESTNSLESAKGVPPQKIAQLEAEVKKMAVGSGAKVESASGPTVMRVLSLSIDANKAAHLAEQIRGLLKTAGSVTIEAVQPAGESAVAQSTRSKIVDLKLQKDRLLVDFLPEAPQVMELDRQIKILEASIKPDSTPARSRLHVSIG